MYKLVKMYRSERKTEEFDGFEHKNKGWKKKYVELCFLFGQDRSLKIGKVWWNLG